MSQNTGTPPCKSTALAAEGKLKEGRITSSPCFNPRHPTAVSRAVVQLVVKRGLVPGNSIFHLFITMFIIKPSVSRSEDRQLLTYLLSASP